MDINLLPFTIVWMILAALIIGLILYRKWVAKDEDDRLHVTASERRARFVRLHKQDFYRRYEEKLAGRGDA